MKSRLRFTSIALCLALALCAASANAVTNELLSSSESHSIEKFNSTGKWLKTFASTGPWIPAGIAANPLTGDVYAATLTNIILRYKSSGALFGPSGHYWRTFNLSAYFGSNVIGSLLFDSSGNLYVASHYGTSGYQIVILKFAAGSLSSMNPAPVGAPIVTTVGRGDQMAWDVFGDICIASFIAPNTVQCYDPGTGTLKFDYAAEFAGASPAIQPVGLAFGPNNNLYVSSVFAGQVLREVTEQVGPMALLTSGLISDINYIASDGRMLYVPSYHNAEARYGGSNYCTFYACNDYDFNADVVYKIDPNSGLATNFITTHMWGPYQMIFVPF